MGQPKRGPGEVGDIWFPEKQPYEGQVLAKVWYTDYQGQGHLRQRKGANRSQAKRRLERLVAEELAVSADTAHDAADITVADFVEMWLEYKKTAPARGKGGRPVTPNSWATLASTARGRIVPGLGATKRLREVMTAVNLHQYRTGVVRRTGRGTKAIDDVLTPMLDWAVRMGYLSENPMASQDKNLRFSVTDTIQAALFDDDDDDDGIHVIPDELVGAWNEAVARFTTPHAGGGRQPNPTLAEACQFALATGLRAGELFALWWEDLDLDADIPTVTVGATLVEPRKGGYETLTRQKFTKSRAGARRLPLLPETVVMLRERKKRTRFWRLHDPVFGNEQGGYLWPGNMRTRLRVARHKHAPAELHDVTWHTLRRTVGTAIGHTYGLEYARWWLGHSSTQITDQFYVAKPTQAPDARAAIQVLVRAHG